MRKALLIAGKDIAGSLSDPTLLTLMFAAPLALATIISATFGGLADGGAPINDIPIGIVNLDEGSGGRDFGAQIAAAFVPDDAGDSPFGELLDAELIADRDRALARVERGVLTAAVIVPTDFTARLTGSTGADSGAEGNATAARLEVHTYLGRPIAAEIVRSVVADVGRQFAAGSVAVRALMETVPEEVSPGTVFSTQAFAHGMGSLQAGQGARVTISQESVSGNEGAFNPLVFFGATQAIFFALFAANGSANSVMEEHREGTLLRLLSSPTRQEQILLGKLVGTVGMILLQLLLLFVAFTAVGSLFEGTLTFIWGRQVGAILLSVVAAAMATAGVGIIVAAAAKDPEQASTIGSITALFMATVGGAFGFQVGPPIAYASVVYWGSRTFSKLAAGDGAIATELAVMVAFGIVAFAGGLAIFRARLRA